MKTSIASITCGNQLFISASVKDFNEFLNLFLILQTPLECVYIHIT